MSRLQDKNEPTQVVEKVSGNECGTCTLCCKLVHVYEIDKPMGKWCPHCSLGKGCQIYEARPTECKTWNCLWLQGAFGNDPDLRPDKCKVVVGYQAEFIMVVEDARATTIWSQVRGRTQKIRQTNGHQAVWSTGRQFGEHDHQRSRCRWRYRLIEGRRFRAAIPGITDRADACSSFEPFQSICDGQFPTATLVSRCVRIVRVDFSSAINPVVPLGYVGDLAAVHRIELLCSFICARPRWSEST